ncbi:MAG: glycosyltransferase family 2 protein [Chloroflexi bacterium]|nr:glycosyltransferase family 2 protein [Chloroflexota bacterium]
MPSISILIPTLNSERVLQQCLESIAAQDYPSDQVEIIIADGGSTDETLAIARRYTSSIFPNPLKTGEAGKAVALQHATGEIVAFIDSDNILPTTDWLSRMIAPFADEEIVGTEPLEYTYRKEDSYITRYCALMGMNDPLCLFLGNYDRYCTLTGEWTEMPVEIVDQSSYLKATLQPPYLPTIGANGFLVRRTALTEWQTQDYFFDIDVVHELASKTKCQVGKVKVGIVHIFSGSVTTFVRKQQRRVNDYLYYRAFGLRKYQWQKTNRAGLVKFILSCVFVLPLVMQSARGWKRKPDVAWLFHPLACWITLATYGSETIRAFLFGMQTQSRAEWKQ